MEKYSTIEEALEAAKERLKLSEVEKWVWFEYQGSIYIIERADDQGRER